MAERRSTRTKRRPDDDELAEQTEDEFEEEPDDELAEEPEDELAEEPDDELEEEPDDEPDEEDSRQRSGSRGRGTKRRPRGGLTAAKAGQAALRQINELIGKTPEGVTGVEPADDGWVVGVEVVEDKRIPSSTDILATYEIEIDSGGDLMSYRRVRRYPRGRGDDEDF